MSASLQERLALASRINKLWYEGSGWLKAVALRDRWTHPDQAAQRALIASYQGSPAPTLELRRGVMRLFLREWLMYNLPEHVGAWGLEVDEFKRITAEEAAGLADQIVAASAQERVEEIAAGLVEEYKPRILARMPWYASKQDQVPPPGVDAKDWDNPGDVPVIPYTQLRAWFLELFDPAEAAFFAHTLPGGGTVRFNAACPRLLGMDRDLIGMLWIED
jgi:hypothetical protein